MIKTIITKIILALDYLVPSRPNYIGFTGLKGRAYSDNTKYFFKYLLYTKSYEVDVVWFVKERYLVEVIKNEEPAANVVYLHSLKGLWEFLKISTVIITHSSLDFRTFPLNNKFVINLWHGIPLKKVRNQIHRFKETENKKNVSPILIDPKYYDIVISSSDEESNLLSECFGIDRNKFVPIGTPRGDHLFKLEITNRSSHSKEHQFLNDNVILYAPTFRDEDKQVKFFPFNDLNLIQIDNFLIENNSWLLLRGHSFDGDIYNEIRSENGLNRIIIADQDFFPDANDLLPFVDILVTDYSSIYFDFLILDRPIIYLPYDLEEYERVRGFLHDYDEVTPGPKIFTQRDFMDTINRYITAPSWYGEKRKEVRDRFFKYQDGKACERIYNLLKEKREI